MFRKRHLFWGKSDDASGSDCYRYSAPFRWRYGIIIALAWLTVNKIHGTLPYFYDTHAETLLFVLPVLLLTIAIVGAAFVSGALASPSKNARTVRNLNPHTRFHA
ncbi:MAG: hypothetical protein WA815_02595 [Terracidiphilus sp.]